MSSRVIKSGSTDQYCEVKVWTIADGAPKTDLVYNTSGLAIWYQIGNASPVQVVVGGSPAPASMSAGGAHADWGIYHVAQGRYKIGLADAVVSSAAQVTVWIAFTDCDSAPCEIDVVGYDKTAVAVGANTTTPATPTDVINVLVALGLDKSLIAQGAERAVSVDNSHRVHSHVYDMQSNTLTANALAADAVAEIQSGLALEATAQEILTDTGTALPAQIAGISAGGGLTEENIADIVEGTVSGVLSVSENIPQTQAGILTAYQSALWEQPFTSLLPLTDHTDITFVLKRRVEDSDADALIKVTKTAGLVVLFGVSSPTSGWATLTVDQESPSGEVTLNILPAAMANIPPGKYIDGMLMSKPNADKVLRSGTTIIRNSPVD